MTTGKKVARRKRSLLELAHEMGNPGKACKIMGYSHQQFYETRRNFQTYGADGLIDRLPGARGPHPQPGRSSRRDRNPGAPPNAAERELPSPPASTSLRIAAIWVSEQLDFLIRISWLQYARSSTSQLSEFWGSLRHNQSRTQR